MLPALQLRVNRRATAAFIRANPTEVTLVPHTLDTTATGGRLKTAQAPRSPQIMTVIEPSSSGYIDPQTVAEGTGKVLDFMLLGEYTAEMAEDDTFQLAGDEATYRIVRMMPDNGYEKRGMVLRDGR